MVRGTSSMFLSLLKALRVTLSTISYQLQLRANGLRLSLKARLERAWMPALSLSMMNQASAWESPKKGLRSRSRSSVLALDCFGAEVAHTRVRRREA